MAAFMRCICVERPKSKEQPELQEHPDAKGLPEDSLLTGESALMSGRTVTVQPKIQKIEFKFPSVDQKIAVLVFCSEWGKELTNRDHFPDMDAKACQQAIAERACKLVPQTAGINTWTEVAALVRQVVAFTGENMYAKQVADLPGFASHFPASNPLQHAAGYYLASKYGPVDWTVLQDNLKRLVEKVEKDAKQSGQVGLQSVDFSLLPQKDASRIIKAVTAGIQAYSKASNAK